jgi:hypothetical protein
MTTILPPWAGLSLGLSALLGAGASRAVAQEATRPPVAIAPLWPADQYQSGRATLELSLSRALDARTERLGLLIGTVDVSGLVDVRGQRVRYRASALRLPSGESEIIAYLVSASGNWQEIGRIPLKVRTRAGLDQGRVAMDLSSTGQLTQRAANGAASPRRGANQDLTLRLGAEGQMSRRGWTITSQANALGVTDQAQRLRWSELQAGAPAIDLSDYRIRITDGRSHVTVGSVTAGNHRHLLNNFQSRGIATALAPASFATFEAAALNGTNVVGWSNALGVMQPDHQVWSAALSMELVPSRPGAIHVRVSGLDGAVLPRTSINEAAVTDAEKTRGVGVEVTMSDPQQRIRFTGGFARSRYLNPADPLLRGSANLVPVRGTVRSARYADLGLQILRGLTLTDSIQATLAALLRHERVDPLYRTIGGNLQADVESNGLELTGSLRAVSLQGSASESHDNLAHIASILTTRTRTRGVIGALPVSALFGGGLGVWYWPTMNISWQLVRQFGEGLPTNGDFSASHIPDQMNRNESASLSWQRGGASLGYRWNRSSQDNRQTGRQQADFRAVVHGLTLSMTPVARLSSSLDLSAERQRNMESASTQSLERVGATAQCHLAHGTSLSGSLSQAWGRDPMSALRTRNTEHHLELSQGFTLYRRLDSGPQGRVYLRYARTRAALLPFETPSLVAPRMAWNLNAGGSLRLY